MADRRSILLVEDNPGDALLIQEMIGASLAAEAWEVTWVQRLDQAARTLGDRAFDVALLDLSLADSAGLATCDELLSIHPALPFVVLTGNRDEATGVAAVRRGAQDFLVKGRFDGALLKRVIQYSIERQRLLQELRNLALVDPLTGLYNRRGFDTVAEQHLRVARRSGKGAFCIFCDVDGLKRINDTSGHRAGDEALCLVAAALRDALRRSDVLARLGGDEFAVLGIETGGAYEDVLVSRIQEALNERTRLASLAFPVDVSLGLARADAETNTSLSGLLDAADQAMYAARNVVRS
jgi:two-component system cell cycle response regulator